MTTPGLARQPFVAPFPNTNKDFRTVCWEFLSTKQKDITRIFGCLAGWISIALPSDNPSGKLAGRVNGFMGNAKNLLSVMEIPDKAINLRKAVSNFIANPSFEGARQLVLKDLTGIIKPICEGIDLSNQFVPYTTDAMRAVKTVNSTATLIGAGKSVVEEVQKIHRMTKIDAQETTLHLINIARDVSYVAVAIIGLNSMILGFAAAPWMSLACLTSGLLFTIGGFFYDRVVVNLDGKHTDINKINHNLRAENDNLTAENYNLTAENHSLRAELACLRSER